LPRFFLQTSTIPNHIWTFYPICNPWCWNMNPNICIKNHPGM
jgi:hypothetical protein